MNFLQFRSFETHRRATPPVPRFCDKNAQLAKLLISGSSARVLATINAQVSVRKIDWLCFRTCGTLHACMTFRHLRVCSRNSKIRLPPLVSHADRKAFYL